jgi:hypothetical protein
MVSDICSSIICPWVEMSSGATQVWSRMGIADAIAITMMVIAKNFAMMLCSDVTARPYFMMYSGNPSGQRSGTPPPAFRQ